jgi:DNA polymerase elongation subunit (family B)
MTLDHHYKFIALLPQESRPKLEAQKHYYGILYDGEIVARGIELRKQDTPKYIKELQTKMIKTLFDCKNIREVYKIGYNKTIQIVKKAIEDIKNNKIPAEELTISKTLRKPLQKYKSMQPHVSAAKQLLSKGEDIKPGNIIKYTYTNTKHHNPICRIKTIPYNGKINVDKRKYINMTISAMKTILSPLESTKEAHEQYSLV